MRDCVASSLQAALCGRAGMGPCCPAGCQRRCGHGEGRVEGGGEGFSKMIGGGGIGGLWFGLRTAVRDRWCVKSRTLRLLEMRK
jgi:hypothetical protein